MPFATTVISRTREMLASGFLTKQPVWWSTVNAYPPITTQPITHVKRSAEDLPANLVNKRIDKRQFRNRHEDIKPIAYPEADKLRDRFFRDHPWEATRPSTLVEGATSADDYTATGLSGKGWIELRQRTLKPSADDCVDFALNLHKAHELDLDSAYKQAVDQFRSLRARHEIETRFAVLEARAHGVKYGPGIIGEGVRVEDAALMKWNKASAVEGSVSSNQSPVVIRDEVAQGDEGRLREAFAGSQYTQPITDGKLNAVGHARREPDPQFTGGLSYLQRKHKVDGGSFTGAEQDEPSSLPITHSVEPRRAVFQDFRRTRLEQFGNAPKSNLPFSKKGWPLPRRGGSNIKRRRTTIWSRKN